MRDPAIDALLGLAVSANTRPELVTSLRALDRVLRHGHYVIPQWFSSTNRIAYRSGKFEQPAVAPQYVGRRLGHLDLVEKEKPCGRAFRTAALDDSHIARDLDDHLCDRPVRAWRPGRADGLAPGARGGGEGPATSGSGYRGRQGVDAVRRGESSSTDSTSRRTSASSRCSGSSRASIWKKLLQQGRRRLILEKLPVSISLGLWTFLFVYAISLPLGIAKAVRAGTRFDTVTTFIVLLGYAVPSFVMGVALLVLFAGGSFVQWFPLRGSLRQIGRI